MYKYKWTKYQLDNLGKAPSELLVDFLDKYRVKKAIDQTCPIMIQRLNGIFQRKPLISMGI